MREARALVVGLSIPSFACSLAAADILATAVNPANGNTYHLLSQNDWTNSEAEALSLGGHLVTIDDQAENDWVFAEFANFGGVERALWIGYSDAGVEGEFEWSCRDASTFERWAKSQPDNGDGGPVEDYTHMLFPSHPLAGQWNDYQNLDTVLRVPLHGVVEIQDCPADVDGSGEVGVGDILIILSAWGSCSACAADQTCDGIIAIDDLLQVLAAWGDC